LAGFDKFRRDVDSSGLMAGLDSFNQQAFGMLTPANCSMRSILQQEDKRVLERYGKGDPKPHGDAAPMLMEQFLAARRLVEAGARCVTVAFAFGTTHGNNHQNARTICLCSIKASPRLLKICTSADWTKDVSVVVWANSAVRRSLIKMPVAIIGPKVSCALLAVAA